MQSVIIMMPSPPHTKQCTDFLHIADQTVPRGAMKTSTDMTFDRDIHSDGELKESKREGEVQSNRMRMKMMKNTRMCMIGRRRTTRKSRTLLPHVAGRRVRTKHTCVLVGFGMCVLFLGNNTNTISQCTKPHSTTLNSVPYIVVHFVLML